MPALPGSGRDAHLHDCQPYGFFGAPKLHDTQSCAALRASCVSCFLQSAGTARRCSPGSLEIPTTNAYRSCPLCWLARNESNTISVVISDYHFSFVRTSRKEKKRRLRMDLSGNSVLGVRRRSTSPSELKPPLPWNSRDKAKKKVTAGNRK